MSKQTKPSIVFAHGLWADGTAFRHRGSAGLKKAPARPCSRAADLQRLSIGTTTSPSWPGIVPTR